jgi:hypothetical protein
MLMHSVDDVVVGSVGAVVVVGVVVGVEVEVACSWTDIEVVVVDVGVVLAVDVGVDLDVGVGRSSLVGEEGGTPFIEVLGGSFSSEKLEVVADLVVVVAVVDVAAVGVVDGEGVSRDWEDRQRRADW